MIDRQQFGEVLDQLGVALRALVPGGVRGFDCGPQALRALEGWGAQGLRPAEAPTGVAAQTPARTTPETLPEIRADLGECTRCPLSRSRTRIVFGSGNPAARLMFVGEGPGQEEDQAGEPFVGAAGQLLTRIIQAIRLQREEVYIANVVKCRPPGNRVPAPDEIRTCLPFLRRQIAAIRPQLICTLGGCATQALLGTAEPISRLRGRFVDHQGIRVMPTFHPAYLLRNEDKKREVWADMKLLMKEYPYES
jgi:DNA polymerase